MLSVAVSRTSPATLTSSLQRAPLAAVRGAAAQRTFGNASVSRGTYGNVLTGTRELLPPRSRHGMAVRTQSHLDTEPVKMAIGALEGLTAGILFGFIPISAAADLGEELYTPQCMFLPQVSLGLVLGTFIGGLLPSQDVMHVARVGLEGVAVVAASTVAGSMAGAAAAKVKRELYGRRFKTDKSVGSGAYTGGFFGGLVGTFVGLSHVISHCQ